MTTLEKLKQVQEARILKRLWQWRPYAICRYGECFSAWHWPYRYEFKRDITHTAFIPLAIMLGVFFALRESCRNFWWITILGVHRGTGK